MIEGKQESQVIALIERICTSSNVTKNGNDLTLYQRHDRADGWAKDGEHILTNGGEEILDPIVFKNIEEYFKEFERKEAKIDVRQDFEMIESFIKAEKMSGRKQRETARLLAARQEVRISAEVAELKDYRLKQQGIDGDQKHHEKITDAEKSYATRKLAIAKAAQLATSDCRKQFKRVRDFFQTLHDDRKIKLRRQYDRSLKIQSVLHRLQKIDPRVRALEQQTAERIFRKKETDIGELNMVQNLEESTYLERIISLLDDVQETKEDAGDDYFQLQIKNLRHQQDANQKREREVTDMMTKSMLEMAESIAKYVKEEMQDREEDNETKELVEKTERKKDFQATSSNVLLSVSDLYDTIVWSVATGSIGMSSSETNSFDSYDNNGDNVDDDNVDDDDHNHNNGNRNGNYNNRSNEYNPAYDEYGGDRDKDNGGGLHIDRHFRDDGSVQSGSTANTTGVDSAENLSPVGHIFVKKLKREMRAAEKRMSKKHLADRKQERRQFRAEARKLKEKHQSIVDGILTKCADERHKLRDAISHRMAMVEENQTLSTHTLQEAIEADVKAMQGAWVEHKRLEEEQKTSFAKAQALISAQVFHEVRNALSSVVAMSEMTSSLQKDPTVTSETLISSVSEMLEQNKEIVNYSLNMLNNILDVSKIKAGSFETKKSFFDLQDLVSRATTMQLVKAQIRGVKMSFTPMPDLQIAYSDEDIVVRIVTNLISNAVKFTTAGAVQPFVCPLESIDPIRNKSIRVDDLNKSSWPLSLIEKLGKNNKINNNKEEDNHQYQDDKHHLRDSGVKYMAVGVADTGPGLSKELLRIAEAGLFSSDATTINSGAKNSGFGLHLAHQLAGTLGSELSLTDLETFQDLCNADMSSTLNIVDSPSSEPSSETGSTYRQDLPGKGTVLYITVPVLSDGHKGKAILESLRPGSAQELELSSKQYVFSPRPAPNSVDGCFRILVADDVSMLRKGLMRSVLDIFAEFSGCPISVSTACTAEDALRAVHSQAYDMFICDNQFAPPCHLNRFSHDDEDTRLQVCNNNCGDKNDIRKLVKEFFAKEAFTIAPGDGSLSGLDALLQLCQTKNQSISIPVLVLHSGHQLELPRQLGVIVVRKPLKRSDFVPLFERNAHNLVETGMCIEVERGDDIVVVNKGGAQLFIKQKSVS